MNKIFAFVGMCGSGKSVACDVLKERGWQYIRFGQITMDVLLKEGMAITPENEKSVREDLRKKHGMAAFAILSIEKIEKALEVGNVVIDGLYSWSEYRVLKDKYGERLEVVAVYTPPRLRYQRLSQRIHDPSDKEVRNRLLTPEQAKARDYAEIENMEKGGPIAMADYTLSNLEGPEKLKQAVLRLIE